MSILTQSLDLTIFGEEQTQVAYTWGFQDGEAGEENAAALHFEEGSELFLAYNRGYADGQCDPNLASWVTDGCPKAGFTWDGDYSDVTGHDCPRLALASN